MRRRRVGEGKCYAFFSYLMSHFYLDFINLIFYLIRTLFSGYTYCTGPLFAGIVSAPSARAVDVVCSGI